MEMLKHAHSGLRWLLLALLLAAIFNAFGKWRGASPFRESDRKLGLFAMIAAHVQLLLGLGLYAISPKVVFEGAAMKDPVMRFFLVEHLTLMLLAIVLITIGHGRAKRAADDASKFRSIFVFYLIGLLLILLGIPWPFQQYGAAWF
jgi:hypothetical protein